MSSNYIAPSNSNSSLSPDSTAFNSNARRSLSSELASPLNIKRRRRSKEKQQDDAMNIRLKKIESNAMKLATARIVMSSGLPLHHPDKKSDATIARKINLEHGIYIIRNSATMMVMQGIIGESPKTRGPNKNIPSQVWNLMKGLFVSFMKLDQASGATQ